MENRSENKIIITVSGVDRIGIVAKVAAVLADFIRRYFSIRKIF